MSRVMGCNFKIKEEVNDGSMDMRFDEEEDEQDRSIIEFIKSVMVQERSAKAEIIDTLNEQICILRQELLSKQSIIDSLLSHYQPFCCYCHGNYNLHFNPFPLNAQVNSLRNNERRSDAPEHQYTQSNEYQTSNSMLQSLYHANAFQEENLIDSRIVQSNRYQTNLSQSRFGQSYDQKDNSTHLSENNRYGAQSVYNDKLDKDDTASELSKPKDAKSYVNTSSRPSIHLDTHVTRNRDSIEEDLFSKVEAKTLSDTLLDYKDLIERSMQKDIPVVPFKPIRVRLIPSNDISSQNASSKSVTYELKVL